MNLSDKAAAGISVESHAGQCTPDRNIEIDSPKPVTVLRAQIEDGEIRIMTNLEKDLVETTKPDIPGFITEATLHENLVGELADEDDPEQKVSLGFLYIGNNPATFRHLHSSFDYGYKRTNLEEAGSYTLSLYMQNKRLPDVLFIDVPLDTAALGTFCERMRNNLLLANLPVIYNEDQLNEEQIDSLAELQLIDDIFNLNSDQVDYFSKAMFLKQCKLYNHTINVARTVLKKKLKLRRRISLFLKRSTDVLGAGLALVILSPIFAAIALIIKLDSRGPVFYTSLRAGRGFKVFRFYKFRSMVPDAEKVVEKMAHLNQYDSETGPKFFKVSKDPRVTRFGKFIRNTSIDELPQLLNVLKGDMSIVGNRPLPLYEAVSLTTDEFVERFSAPAGITGLWQVNKRGKADMSSQERIDLDITYSRRYSFLYDLRIIAKTPVALLQKSDV